jgi:hypothetical protein
MMRAAMAWTAVFAPALAGAAGWTDLRGTNAAGEQVVFRHLRTVTVQRQWPEQAYAQHVKADVLVFPSGGGERRHAMQDCLHSERPDGNAWLTCSPEGDSPLAGATYHQAPPVRDSVSPWRCFSHCSRSTPMELSVTPARGIVVLPPKDKARP